MKRNFQNNYEELRYGCRMCTERFKYANQMWKHVKEEGHQVSNVNYYNQKPGAQQQDYQNKREVKAANKNS